MRIVVDTNILFSYFWKGSFTKSLLKKPEFKLISPTYALKEIKKYKKEIEKRTKITEKEFIKCLNELRKDVEFIKRDNYSEFIGEAEKISPDIKDAEFLALCLKEKTFLWSNDLLLKEQSEIRVISTEDIINLLFD